MTTTLITFPVQANPGDSPQSFSTALDNKPHTVAITFNVAAQRRYVNIYADDGTLVCAVPMIGTAPGYHLNGLYFDPTINSAVVTLLQPLYTHHVGQIVEYQMENCSPDGYNGFFQTLTLSPVSFSYPLPADPGPTGPFGTAIRLINLIGPWFKTTSLAYRNNSLEFRTVS